MFRFRTLLVAIFAVCFIFGLANGQDDQEAEKSAPANKGPVKCEEENGFYPHETDCSKFWACHDNIRYDFSCNPSNLHYNVEKNQCDYPHNVQCNN